MLHPNHDSKRNLRRSSILSPNHSQNDINSSPPIYPGWNNSIHRITSNSTLGSVSSSMPIRPNSSGLLHSLPLPEDKYASSRRFIKKFLKLKWLFELKEIILRQKKLPPTKDGRKIPLKPLDVNTSPKNLIDERTSNSYKPNIITSSVYTFYSFFPLQIIAQLSKFANIYFLVISILQMIPSWSATGTYTTIIPLLIFMSISMSREAYDDFCRHRHDKEENNRKVQIAKINPHAPDLEWTSIPWEKVSVGDIVRLSKDDWVPADIVLLHTNGLGGAAFIETAALDGETNLKSKKALPRVETMCSTPEKLLYADALFTVEDPNLDLYNFEGKVEFPDGEVCALGNGEVVYRGCIIRNTPEVFGLVIFTGEETKVRMNSVTNPRVKAPKLQSSLNGTVLVVVFVVLFCSIFCAAAHHVSFKRNKSKVEYLHGQQVTGIANFMGYLIMYNTLIPLSLYVSMEIIKVSQIFFLQWDIDLYHEETDTPCEAHTASINEELGQVSYIFTDKTGTLTDNMMLFRKMTIAGHGWIHDLDIRREEYDKIDEIESTNWTHKPHAKNKRISLGDVADASRKSLQLFRNATVAAASNISHSTPNHLGHIRLQSESSSEFSYSPFPDSSSSIAENSQSNSKSHHNLKSTSNKISFMHKSKFKDSKNGKNQTNKTIEPLPRKSFSTIHSIAALDMQESIDEAKGGGREYQEERNINQQENIIRDNSMASNYENYSNKDVNNSHFSSNAVSNSTGGKPRVSFAANDINQTFSKSNLTNEDNQKRSGLLPMISTTVSNSDNKLPSTGELIAYIMTHPYNAFSKQAKLFLLSIALCHTCLPEKVKRRTDNEDEEDENGLADDIVYQASSPDELALVTAAKELGYINIDRDNNKIVIRTFPNTGKSQTFEQQKLSQNNANTYAYEPPQNKNEDTGDISNANSFNNDGHVDEVYEILNVIEFSSARKRMSVIVKFPDSRICLICKGADSIILERMSSSTQKLVREKSVLVHKKSVKRKKMEAEQVISRKSIGASIAESTLPTSPINTARKSLNLNRNSLSSPTRLVASLDMNRAAAIDNLDEFLRRAHELDGIRGSFSNDRINFVETPLSRPVDEFLARKSLHYYEQQEAKRAGNKANTKASFTIDKNTDTNSSMDKLQDDITAVNTNLNSNSNLRNVPVLLKNHRMKDASHLESLIDERLVNDEAAVIEKTLEQIEEFSTEGLRTLLYSYKFLDDDVYEKWATEYQGATTALVDRQKKIEEVSEKIEQSLTLSGATAIEDKLQKGVPETIDKLRRAQIRLWMLTGDKRETAINIGHSCRLVKDYSLIVSLRLDDSEMTVNERIQSTITTIDTNTVAHCVVVVDGATLSLIESDQVLLSSFIELGIKADSVICCRVSPSQKANVVKAVRSRLKKKVALAIGDGANDIAMIQAADVGIGITGREGLQAARASDYSIAQFRFLQKLLFVHGRWNYVRTCKYILGTFYKEFLFYLSQALYQRFNMYSGTSLYEQWSLSMFNTLFTSLPVIFLGIFEKDLAPATLIAVPELYSIGQTNVEFNYYLLTAWLVLAVVQTIFISFMVMYMYGGSFLIKDNNVYAIGMCSYTAILVVIIVKLLFIEMHSRTIMCAFASVVSVGGWFAFSFALQQSYLKKQTYLTINEQSLVHKMGKDLTWWLTLLFCIVIPLGMDLTLNAFRVGFFPKDVDVFQQIERDPILKRRLEEEASSELQQGWQGIVPDYEREIQDLLSKPRVMEEGSPLPESQNLNYTESLNTTTTADLNSEADSFKAPFKKKSQYPLLMKNKKVKFNTHSHNSSAASAPYSVGGDDGDIAMDFLKPPERKVKREFLRPWKERDMDELTLGERLQDSFVDFKQRTQQRMTLKNKNNKK